MKHRLFKMLMNAEGSSPGGGAAPPPSGTPAPQAHGASPGTAAPALDLGQIVDQVKNGIFAELRRSGVLKSESKPKPDNNGTEAATTAASSAPGISPDDVQKLVARATAFERIATASNLTDAQRRRMEAAMRAENPEDVSAWARGYLEDMNIVKPPTNAPTTPNGGTLAPTVARGPNPSDRGTAARDASLAHQGEVWKMTPADVQALVREKGYQAAAHELRQRMRQDLQGRRLLLGRRPGG